MAAVDKEVILCKLRDVICLCERVDADRQKLKLELRQGLRSLEIIKGQISGEAYKTVHGSLSTNLAAIESKLQAADDKRYSAQRILEPGTMFERQDSNSKINFFLTMDDNTVQVVPTYQAGITVDTDGNSFTIPTCVTSCDADGNPEVSNYVFNSGATNFLSTDAMYTISMPVQSEETSSVMDVYNGIKDKNLAEAATRALVEGDMTPLIKEELKYSIQSKRMKEGKPELKVEFTEPQPDQLTEEELERVEKRKVQNRMAARRFRDKQRTRGDQLQKECQKLQSTQTQLRFELSQVKKERDELRRRFDDHLLICPLRYTHQCYSNQNNTG